MARTAANSASARASAAPPTSSGNNDNAGDGNNDGAPPVKRGRGRPRRSTHVKDHDPIVADGFGTLKDLQKLSSDLQVSLPAVQAMMGAKGRGITSSRRREAEDEPTTTVATGAASAWTDFMQDVGELATGESKNSTTISNAEQEETSVPVAVPPAAFLSSASSQQQQQQEQLQQRTYDLSVLQTKDKVGPPAFKKVKQQPQHQSIVLQAGSLDWMTIGRNKRGLVPFPDMSVPTSLPFPKVSIATVVTACSAVHSLAISTQGQVFGWGRNETSQLTGSLPTVVVIPTLLDIATVGSDQHHTTVVGGAVGKGHSVVLTNHGEVYAVGFNKVGQCGVSMAQETISKFKKCQVATATPVSMVQVSCGEDFTVTLDDEGCLYSTGSSEFGQLGNGETGQYFITASKLVFANCQTLTPRTVVCHVVNEKCHGGAATDYKVVPMPHKVSFSSISCGKHHTVAVEAPSEQGTPRVFTWGCGDYGCLGHGVQKDEYFPRLVASFAFMLGVTNPPIRAAAGSQCSLVQTQQGHVYYWGKHRNVGEAVMRPQIIDALANNGHVVTACAAGYQTVVCSTKAAVTIAWGHGPNGELGLGAPKSSAKPQFVNSLQNVPIAHISCGYGHTLYLVQRQEDEEDDIQEAISKLPEVDMDELAPLLAAASASGSGGGGADEGAKKSSKKKR